MREILAKIRYDKAHISESDIVNLEKFIADTKTKNRKTSENIDKIADKSTETPLCFAPDKINEGIIGEAAYHLGLFYFSGNGKIPPDNALLLKWMDFAANQNYPQAMLLLSEIYTGIYGENIVQIDTDKALYWIKRCAQMNFPAGIRELACYYYGIHDYEKAYSYYFKAAGKGDVDALIALAEMTDDGLGISRKNPKLASMFYKMAAETGNIWATALLGERFLHGIGMDQDLEKGCELLKSVLQHWLIDESEI